MKKTAFFLLATIWISFFPTFAPADMMDVVASDLGGGRISIGYEVTSGSPPLFVFMSVHFSNGAFLKGPDDIVFFDPFSLSPELSEPSVPDGTPPDLPWPGFPKYDVDFEIGGPDPLLPLIIDDLVTLQLHAGDSYETEVTVSEYLARGGITGVGGVSFDVTWPEPFTVTIPEPWTLSLMTLGFLALRKEQRA